MSAKSKINGESWLTEMDGMDWLRHSKPSILRRESAEKDISLLTASGQYFGESLESLWRHSSRDPSLCFSKTSVTTGHVRIPKMNLLKHMGS